jgi:glycosyltransferase involved in cell wall biosynthesis
MYRLSVIITTYNRQHLLGRAIESVRDAGMDTEIIVVDDASADSTREFCESLSGIRYIRQEKNQGTAAARNAGILASNSPYIAFLDDDDWRLPGGYALQVSLLEREPACGLVHGKVLFANQQLQLTGESTIDDLVPQGEILLPLLNGNFIKLSSVVMRKECFRELGLFDTSPGMLGIEDWDMWLRLATRYQVLSVNEPVAVYRRPEKNSGQWYSDLGRQFSLAGKAYKKKWFCLPGVEATLGREFRSTRRRLLSRTSDIIVYGALNSSKDLMDKGARFRAAISCWPENLVTLRFYKALAKAVLNRP